MDRNFYHQYRARERQREISQELANRQLLKGVKHEPLTPHQAGSLVVRLAPAVIVLAILLAFVVL